VPRKDGAVGRLQASSFSLFALPDAAYFSRNGDVHKRFVHSILVSPGLENGEAGKIYWMANHSGLHREFSLYSLFSNYQLI
jgi:hypothetical protein